MDDGQKTVLDAYRDMKQQVGEVCQLIAVSLQSWFAAAKQRQQPQPQKVSVPAPQEQQPMESVSTPQPPIQPQERPQQPQKEVSVTPQTQQQQQLSQQEVSVSPPQAQAQAQRQVNEVSDAPPKTEPQPRQQSETQANPSVREKGTIPSGVVNLPTPEEEAAILYRAFTGRGCDVGRLLRVLTQRDATHRQLIRQQYRKNYGEELSDRIEVTMASYTYKNANAAPARRRPQQKPQGLGQRESQERYPMDFLSLANVGFKFVKTVVDTEPEVNDQDDQEEMNDQEELDDQLDDEDFDENDDRDKEDEDFNEDEEEDADDPNNKEFTNGKGTLDDDNQTSDETDNKKDSTENPIAPNSEGGNAYSDAKEPATEQTDGPLKDAMPRWEDDQKTASDTFVETKQQVEETQKMASDEYKDTKLQAEETDQKMAWDTYKDTKQQMEETQKMATDTYKDTKQQVEESQKIAADTYEDANKVMGTANQPFVTFNNNNNNNAAAARRKSQQKPQGLGQQQSQGKPQQQQESQEEQKPMESGPTPQERQKPQTLQKPRQKARQLQPPPQQKQSASPTQTQQQPQENKVSDTPPNTQLLPQQQQLEWQQGQGQQEFQERAISLWLMEESERDATIVWQSLQPKSLDKAALNEVICSRTPSQIRNLKRAYFTYFKSELSKDITCIFVIDRNTRELLVACLDDKARDEGTNVDVNKAKEDATQLYKDGEQKMWGTNNKTFIDIFAKRSRPHLAAVDAAYDKLYGHSLEEAVRKETSRSFMAGLLTLLKCAKNPAKYFAEVLYNSMKGLGTSDTTLIRVVVTRAGIDMEDIKKEYEQAYKTSLKDCIHNDTSGDYRTFLLNLLE